MSNDANFDDDMDLELVKELAQERVLRVVWPEVQRARGMVRGLDLTTDMGEGDPPGPARSTLIVVMAIAAVLLVALSAIIVAVSKRAAPRPALPGVPPPPLPSPAWKARPSAIPKPPSSSASSKKEKDDGAADCGIGLPIPTASMMLQRRRD